MRRRALRSSALSLWAGAAGLALWAPALALPLGGLPLQPLDLIVLAGWPLILGLAPRLPAVAVAVLCLGLASVLIAWTTMGGVPIILGWTLGLAFPFVALMALAAADASAGRALLSAFLAGAAGASILFLAQIAIGAETLDFRNNPAFRLPPHYGRGFALFPEVSTFAAHATIAFAAALALVLHPETGPARRRRLVLLVLLLASCLVLSRSTTVLVCLPPLVALALARTTRASANTLILAALVALCLAAGLMVFLQSYYIERLETNAATRSAAMRLASILGGLTPLVSGEVFGVGIGRNEAIGLRAHEVARALGLVFGTLPEGVNAQLVGRIFEEGWPAVLQATVAGGLLVLAIRRARRAEHVALAVIATGSLFVAGAVIGYRGIYTVWLWLALPAGILALAARPASRSGLAQPA